MDIEAIARQLGGAVLPVTEFGTRCNCPCCGDKESNLVLKLTPTGIYPHCCKGCAPTEVHTALSALGLLNGNGTPHKESPPQESPHKAIDVGDWIAQPATPIAPILEGVFDHGDKVVIIGQSKTRKSFFAEQLAISLAAGTPYLGLPVTGKKRVLLIQSEIRKDQYHWRCIRMCKELGIESQDIKGHLWVVNARGCGAIDALIEARAEELSPEVIIIDPFYKVLAGDENSSEDIKVVLKAFDRLAESTGAAVVYIHHDKKGVSGDSQLTDRGSGSGVLARDFDSAIFLSPHKNKQDLVVEFIARNYPPREAVTVTWWDYHFALSNETPEKATTKTLSQPSALKLDEQVRLARELLGEKLLAGYAKLPMNSFNAILEDKGIKARRLAAVKEELLRSGEIAIETVKAAKGESNKVVRLLGPPESRDRTLFEEI